jgi:hypothetical protein
MHANGLTARGIRAKLARAISYLEQLNPEMGAFMDRRPVVLSTPVEVEPNVLSFKLVYEQPIPIEWGVRLGEFVHNLRSALDNAVTLLVETNNGTVTRHTGFPIFDDPAKWRDNGHRKIDGAIKQARTFIESLQPLPGNDGVFAHYLKSLNDLWNADKHRVVQIWGYRLRTVEAYAIATEPEAVSVLDVRFASGVIHEGAEVIRIALSGPVSHVEVRSPFAFDIVVETPSDPTGTYDGDLWSVYHATASVANTLLAMVDDFPSFPPY